MSRLEWPVRTLSFSHNGRLLAAASEDHLVDICNVSEFVQFLSFNMHDRNIFSSDDGSKVFA